MLQFSQAYQERVASCVEHHRETIASFFPTSSANYFPVLPFSTNTTFSLLIFCDSIRFDLLVNYNTLICNANIVIILEKYQIEPQKSSLNALITKYICYMCIHREKKRANKRRKQNYSRTQENVSMLSKNSHFYTLPFCVYTVGAKSQLVEQRIKIMLNLMLNLSTK